MPEKGIVEPNQLEKDQEDFASAFGEIVDKTDEEIKEEEAKKAQEADGAGDATKDQSNDADNSQASTDDTTDDESASQQKAAATDTTDNTDWKAEAEKFESELKKERQRTSSWEGRIRVANEKAKKLEAEIVELRKKLDDKATAKANEDDQSDEEVMSKFKETFPELVEVLDIYQKKIDKLQSAAPAKTEPEPVVPDTTTDDTQSKDDEAEQARNAAAQEHRSAIVSAHPEIDEIVGSGILLTWINQQPDYIRPHLEDVYYGKDGKGSSQQVVAMITEFKNKTGWKSQLVSGKNKDKSDKLKSMEEVDSTSGGPVDKTGPDKNDFDQGAKDAGL